MTKLFAILNLLRQGCAVSDPVAWKRRQITLIPLMASLVGVLKVFNIDLGLTDEQIAMFATGLLAVINGLLTIATTDKLGLPSKPDSAGTAPADAPDRAGSDIGTSYTDINR